MVQYLSSFSRACVIAIPWDSDNKSRLYGRNNQSEWGAGRGYETTPLWNTYKNNLPYRCPNIEGSGVSN